MSTEPPPTPLPPQSLPPQPTAAGRLQALREECEAAGDSPVAAVAWYELGALYEHGMGEGEQAQQCYRRAFKLDGTFAPPLMALERIYGGLPDYSRLARVLEARHTVAEGAHLRAQLLTEHAIVLSDQLGEVERAEAQLESALSEDPTCQEAALMLEHQWQSRGQPEDATLMVEARAGQVGDPALRALLLCESAATQRSGGAFAQAETLLERAGELGQGRFSALRNRHGLSLERGQVGDAVAALSAMLALAEGFAHGVDRTVEEDNAPLGRFQTADLARQACACMAYELYLHERYAKADMEAARNALLKALSFLPATTLASEYAELCAQTGEIAEAARVAQDVLQGAPAHGQQPLWLFRLAEAQLLAGDSEAAIERLEQGLADSPDSPALAATLLRLLVVTRQWSRLARHLALRAAHVPEDRLRLLSQALHAAAALAKDAERSAALLAAVTEDESDAPLALEAARTAFVSAHREGWQALRSKAVAHLGRHSADETERTFFAFLEFYENFREGVTARRLAEYLQRAELRPWAPQMLRVLAAFRSEPTLLAESHAQLATIANDPGQRSAHHTCAARAFALASQDEEAERHLRSALSHQPDNAYALSLLCMLHERRGEDLSAMELLRESARRQSDDRVAAQRLLQAGLSAERAQEPESALRHLADAVQRDPDLTAAHFARYGLALDQSDHRAQAQALLALADKGLVDDVTVDVAELDARMGDAAASDRLALRALEEGTQSAYAALRLAVVGASDEERNRGISHLCRVHPRADLRLDGQHQPPPDSPREAVALARVLSALRTLASEATKGERAAAWAALASTCEDDSTLAELQLLAIQCAMMGGGSEAAAEAVVSALALHDEAPDQEATAIALDDAVGPGDAPELRKLALTVRMPFQADGPHLRALTRQLAFAQLDAGDTDAALHTARRLTSEDSHDAPSAVLLRAAALRAQSHADVVLANDLLVRECPKALAAELLVEAADCLKLHLVDSIGAELRLRRALDLDPLSDDAFDRLHDLLLERRDGEGLLALLEERLAIQSDTTTASLHYDAARLHSAMERHGDTIRHLNQLLQYEPLHVGALSLLANAEHESKNTRGAVAALDKLASTDLPAAQRRLVRLGATDFLVDPLEDAAGALQQLRALHDEGLARPEDEARLAELAAECGQLDEAVTAYRRAADQAHGARRCQWLRAAGRLLERIPDRLHDAIETYRAALAAVPTDRASHTSLYRLMPSPTERLREATEFLSAVQERLGETPLDADLLRGMRVAGHHGAMSFVEYAALDALSALELSDHAEETARQLLAHHRATELQRSPLSDEGLELLRASADRGPLAVLAEQCSTLLGEMLEDPRKALGRRERSAKSTLRDALPRELSVLGLSLRHLYIVSDANTPIRLLSTKDPRAVDVIATEAVRAPLLPTVRFRLGLQACAQRTGTLALSSISAAERRSALVAMAIVCGALDVATPSEDIERLEKGLNQQMPRRMRRELQQMATELRKAMRGLDTYLAAAETTRLRGGLMQCDTLGPALSALGATAGHIAQNPEAVALLRFWTSAKCVALHGESVHAPLRARRST